METHHPTTIINDRYGGIYSGALWLAFPLEHYEAPREADGCDRACVSFWDEYREPVGKGGSREWNDILSRLNGEIYLILGNHDMKQIGQGFMQRFAHVTQQMTIRVGGQSIVLNHNPFLAYGGAYRNVWQLFGHVHSGPLSGKGKDGDSGSGKDLPRLSMLFPRQYDVGVDNNDFRPVSFAEVKTIIQHQINLKNE